MKTNDLMKEIIKAMPLSIMLLSSYAANADEFNTSSAGCDSRWLLNFSMEMTEFRFNSLAPCVKIGKISIERNQWEEGLLRLANKWR